MLEPRCRRSSSWAGSSCRGGDSKTAADAKGIGEGGGGGGEAGEEVEAAEEESGVAHRGERGGRGVVESHGRGTSCEWNREKSEVA